MCYPTPGPKCSAHVMRAFDVHKRILRVESENKDSDPYRVQIIKDNLRKLHEDYALTSKSIRDLKKKAKETNQPHLRDKANEYKTQAKEAVRLLKQNKYNQEPSGFTASHYFGGTDLTDGESLRVKNSFSFAILRHKNGDKMVPAHALNSTLMISDSFVRRDFYTILGKGDETRHLVQKNSFSDMIVDDELMDSINDWAENYNLENEDAPGMIDRKSIYDTIRTYTVGTLALAPIKEKANTDEQRNLVKVEEEYLQDKRDSLLKDLHTNTQLMKFLNEERDNADELEKSDREDDEFSAKISKYRELVR